MPEGLIFQTTRLPAPLLLHEYRPAPPWALYKLTLPVGYGTTKKYSRSQTELTVREVNAMSYIDMGRYLCTKSIARA